MSILLSILMILLNVGLLIFSLAILPIFIQAKCKLYTQVIPQIVSNDDFYLVFSASCKLDIQKVTLHAKGEPSNVDVPFDVEHQYFMFNNVHMIHITGYNFKDFSYKIHNNKDVDIKGNIQFPSTKKVKLADADNTLLTAQSKNHRLARLLFVSDNQSGTSVFKSILKSVHEEYGNSLDYFIHGGDSVQVEWLYFMWKKQFLDPMAEYNHFSNIPWILAHGNHDYSAKRDPLYRPKNRNWYSIDIKSSYVIVLDTNLQESKEQMDWFKAEITKPAFIASKFRIIVGHIGPFVEYWDSERSWKKEDDWDRYLRNHYVSLFEEAKIDLYLSGHQHNYQRGTKNGITYVTAGGAGGGLDKARVNDYGFNAVTKIEHHYVVIDIEDSKIVGTCRNQKNQVIDEFEIISTKK